MIHPTRVIIDVSCTSKEDPVGGYFPFIVTAKYWLYFLCCTIYLELAQLELTTDIR